MDIRRLEKLAALAGLSLEGLDRARLLREISALEELAASLPEQEAGEACPADTPDPLPPQEAAPLDRALMQAAAPALEEGFFLIPGVPHRGAREG